MGRHEGLVEARNTAKHVLFCQAHQRHDKIVVQITSSTSRHSASRTTTNLFGKKEANRCYLREGNADDDDEDEDDDEDSASMARNLTKLCSEFESLQNKVKTVLGCG